MQHTIVIDNQERDIAIRPMGEDFILWRCLHRGPLSKDTIEQWPDPEPDWLSRRAINMPLLRRFIRTYGTCAILAWDGEQVVGFIRFYPKIICSMEDAGGLCMQQAFPAGPSERLVNCTFPPFEQIPERTVTIHCLMTGSPFQEKNPYQRKGLGAQMVRGLIRWATERGWEALEAAAYEDLHILYQNTGQAGRSFWEKLGFRAVETGTEPGLQGEGEFFTTLRRQAVAQGLSPERAATKYTMRMNLA